MRVLRRALPLLLGWLAGAFVAVEGGLGDELALADVARPEAQADVLDRRGQVALELGIRSEREKLAFSGLLRVGDRADAAEEDLLALLRDRSLPF